jgi:hypothetical protein
MIAVGGRAELLWCDAEMLVEGAREGFQRAVAGVERYGEDIAAPPARMRAASLRRRARM